MPRRVIAVMYTMNNRQQLEQAIAVQESLRGTVDEAIIDATIQALRAQLDALEPAVPESRRALATILFIDLADHTDLIRGRDAEEIMEIIDRALERLAEPVARHGGRVVRYQGDGYKAVFGLPTAQENDPDNAVLAALDILATATAIADELEAERQLPGFRVRVGIDTGPVLIGGGTEGEDAVTGLPVNLAARLESAAEPGTVLISHHTYQHVRGVFDVQPLAPVQAKGFPEPVAVYRVLRRKPRSFRTRRRGVEGIETRMIGRELELDALRSLFARMIKEHTCLSAVIVGEAGLGKSRLMYEFENWVDLQPVNVRFYRGRARLETSRLPYGLLRDLFAFRCGIYDDDPPEVVREKFVAGFRALFAADADVEMKAHFVGHLLGYDFSAGPYVGPLLGSPQHIRAQALRYLADYFHAATQDNPVLMLLEDLHWADDSSLDALESLASGLAGRPIFLVGAARPALYERRSDWMAGRASHHRIDLARLDEDAGGRLVGEILQRMPAVPDALRDLIVATAEGNPFYAEELIKMLIDEGVILTGEDAWRVEMDRLSAIHVPPTLTGVLLARLEGLPPDERQTLQRASVIGRLFWDSAVEYIAAAGSPQQAGDPVWGALRRRELIYLREETAFDGTREYGFSHALLRDVTYESVLRRLRRDYHRRAAAWLIRAGGSRVDEYADLIAGHYAQAGDEAQEAEWQARAGKQAASRYATAEAIRAFSRALELLPPQETTRRINLLLSRENLYNIQAAREAQAADLGELERLTAGEAAETRAEVALRRADYALGVGDLQSVIDASAEAAALAAQSHDEARQARAALFHGIAVRFLGDFKGSQARLQEALDRARAANARPVEMDALRHLGVTAQELGDTTAESFYFGESLRMARELGDRWAERRALNSLGIIEQNRGDYAAADALFEESLAVARAIGDRTGENTVLGNLGIQAYQLGRYARAEELFEEALRIARETDDQLGVNITLLNLAYIVALNGDVERALALSDEARRSVEAIGDRPLLGYVENGAGRALLENGRPIEALAALRRALALREELAQPHLAAETRALVAEALAASGDTAAALTAIDAVLAFLETGSTESVDDMLRCLLAAYRVLSAAGDDRAIEVLRRAHEQLQNQSAQIDEPSRREYLENVPWNREIVDRWQQLAGG